MSVLARHAGVRFSTSGRIALGRYYDGKDLDRLRALACAFGGELAPLAMQTRYVLAGTGAGTKTLERLKAGGAEIETIDIAGLRALFSLTSAELLELIAAGADGLGALRALQAAFGLLDPQLPSLASANLRGATISDVGLVGVALAGADLRGVEATGTHFGTTEGHWDERAPIIDLTAARFDGARLGGAQFDRAILEGASFRDADLSQATLTQCNLTGVDFHHADLRGATLKEVEFGGSDLRAAELDGATLHDIRGGDFSGVDLSAVTVTGSCRGTRLRETRLPLSKPVDFHGCDLFRADFSGSDLAGADLSSSELDGARLEGAATEFARLERLDGPARQGDAVRGYLDAVDGLNVRTSVRVERGDAVAALEIHSFKPGAPVAWWQITSRDSSRVRNGGSIEDLDALGRWFGMPGDIVRIESVAVSGNSSGAKLRGEGLEQSARDAWAELLAVPSLSSQAIREHRARTAMQFATRRDELAERGEAELLTAIDRDPANADLWLVYADWLQEHGDIRGEIIMREHRAGDDRELLGEVAELTRAHAEQLLGDLAGTAGLYVDFRFGFIDTIRMQATGSAAKLFRRLTTHPAARFARVLNSSTAAKKTLPALHDFISARPIEELSLMSTGFSDAGSLGPYQRLRKLDLSNTRIESIDGLAPLTGLVRLRARNTSIDSLECLEAMRGLEQLDLAHTAVRVLTPLGGLPELAWLNLQNTRISDFEALDSCPKLRYLRVNIGVDVGALAKRRDLEVEYRAWSY